MAASLTRVSCGGANSVQLMPDAPAAHRHIPRAQKAQHPNGVGSLPGPALAQNAPGGFGALMGECWGDLQPLWACPLASSCPMGLHTLHTLRTTQPAWMLAGWSAWSAASLPAS